MKPHRKGAASKNTSRLFLASITIVDYNTVSLITFTLSNSKSQKAKGIPFAIYRLQRNSEEEEEEKREKENSLLNS